MQKERAVKSFTENIDKFENVHNYICRTYPFFRFNSIDFSKNSDSNQAENPITDRLVFQQMQYIFDNLHFEYIEKFRETHTLFLKM